MGVFAGTLKDSKDVGFAILEILDGKNLEPKDRCGNAIHLQGCPKHSIKEMADDQTKCKVEIERETEREKRREEADGFLRRCVYFAGLPDPYVKITVDKMKFKTSIKKQTLHPVWHELFRICICSWNLPSKILLRARDRDSFGKDDELVKTPDQSICSPLLINY